jgi:hypothetical protein
VVKLFNPTGSLELYPKINGLYVASPFGAIATCGKTKSYYCTSTGTFWFDVDALEVANPGSSASPSRSASAPARSSPGMARTTTTR